MVEFLDQFFKKSHLQLKDAWLQRNGWLNGGDPSESIDQQQQKLLGQVMANDLRDCCLKGSFSDVNFPDEYRRKIVEGLYIVQVNEAVNIHTSYKTRYLENDSKRCLKLLLCDGEKQFVGIEHQPCPQLSVNMPSGAKILLTNPQLVGNKVLLTPQSMNVLGGYVEVMEQARQRMVSVWSQLLKFEKNCGKEQKYQQYMQRLGDAAWKDFQQMNQVLQEIDDALQQDQPEAANNNNNNLQQQQELDEIFQNAENDLDLFPNQENQAPQQYQYQQQQQQGAVNQEQLYNVQQQNVAQQQYTDDDYDDDFFNQLSQEYQQINIQAEQQQQQEIQQQQQSNNRQQEQEELRQENIVQQQSQQQQLQQQQQSQSVVGSNIVRTAVTQNVEVIDLSNSP